MNGRDPTAEETLPYSTYIKFCFFLAVLTGNISASLLFCSQQQQIFYS